MVETTKKKSIDLNLKVYKNIDFGRVWEVFSYRRSLEGAQYIENGIIGTQNYNISLNCRCKC
jgi:hypothetical protein